MTYAWLSQTPKALAGVAAANTFLKELLDRSPGARSQAELIKTKNKPASEMLSAAVLPKEAAILSTIPSLVDVLNPLLPTPDIVLPADVLLMEPGPLFAVDGTDLPVAQPGVGGVPGGVGLPGGVGGVVSPPGTVTPVGPPALSAVPEPGTWATMLLGFLMIGGALRFRPSHRRWASAHGKS